MSRMIGVVIVIGLVMVVAWPVAGQSKDPLVAYVIQAADNLMNQETAVFEGASKVITGMDMGGASQSIEITADITGQYIFAAGDFEAWYTVEDLEFSMGVPGAGAMQFALTQESLMADATLYERQTSDSPMFASALPVGWHIVDDAAGTPGAGSMADPTAMMPGIDITKLPYIIGQQTVASVSELEPEIIDGREMRVFSVEMDLDAASKQMGAWMSGLPNENLDDENAIQPSEMMSNLFSEMEMVWTVWIDTALELPYRSSGTMVGPLTVGQPGIGTVMELDLTFDMTFTEYNVPVTIEAPELGS